jgi:hypothetical protein
MGAGELRMRIVAGVRVPRRRGAGSVRRRRNTLRAGAVSSLAASWLFAAGVGSR